jgi:hypothetical protein
MENIFEFLENCLNEKIQLTHDKGKKAAYHHENPISFN